MDFFHYNILLFVLDFFVSKNGQFNFLRQIDCFNWSSAYYSLNKAIKSYGNEAKKIKICYFLYSSVLKIKVKTIYISNKYISNKFARDIRC